MRRFRKISTNKTLEPWTRLWVYHGIRILVALVSSVLTLHSTASLAAIAGNYSKATGIFLLQSTTTNSVPDVISIAGAQRTWLPLLGDFSGDGLIDYALYDPATGTFHLRSGPDSGPVTEFRFEGFKKSWLPITGDWNGDKVYGVGLYDPKKGIFHLKDSLATGPEDLSFRLDGTGRNWKPLAGDWNGDGITTVGVYNPVTGKAYLSNTNLPLPADRITRIQGVKKTATPLGGDWNDDGIWSLGLYESARQTFYWRNALDIGPIEGSSKIQGSKSSYLPVAGPSNTGGSRSDNHPPVIGSRCPTSGNVGALYTCAAHATDPDGDPLAYGLSIAPPGMAIDSASGMINWTPTVAGTFNFTLTANDGRGGNTAQSTALQVASESTQATVPKVVGQAQGAAGTSLANAGLTTGTITPQCSNTVANGLVIGQNPAAGASVAFGSTVALVISTGNCPAATPQLVIDHWPTYASTENLSGHMTAASDAAEYKIVPYIRVGGVYWIKPTLANPYCPLASNGTFACDIATGGNDVYADSIVVYLVAADYVPPSCNPCYQRPTISAVDTKSVERVSTVNIDFAGRKWALKRSDYPAGPGPTRFCDQSDCVWVDAQGLHLTVKNRNGVWYGTEAILQKSLGYGTYIFNTHGRVDHLDPNVVLGLFTWDPEAEAENFREIDLEIAKWGIAANATNAQFVLQPCTQCPGCGDHCSRYQINQSDSDQDLTLYLVWQPGKLEMRTYRNHQGMNPAPGDLIASWSTAKGIPTPGKENIRTNFWLYNGEAPTNGQNHAVTIANFAYQPGSPTWSNVIPGTPGIAISGVSPYGDANGTVWGAVTGVNPADYKVAVYILVGGGWWTKPTWDSPLTSIAANGTWTCDITTGGADQDATKVVAYLVPSNYSPPGMSGETSLPAELDKNFIGKAEVARNP